MMGAQGSCRRILEDEEVEGEVMNSSPPTTVPALRPVKARSKGARSQAAPPKGDPQSTPNPSQDEGGGGATVHESVEQIVVAHFSIVGAQNLDRERLFGMRDCMHRILNTALSEWYRADKVPSERNPDKETLDRGPVTEAVKVVLAENRAYWAKQLPKAQANVEKTRHALGRAKTKGRPSEIARLEAEMLNAQRGCERARVRSELMMPSAVYDAAVRWTRSRLAVYRKAAFLGERTIDTYRAGQPIRWRDGEWTLIAADRRGAYDLTLPMHSDGKHVERATFRVIPDGPSMHAHAKRMIDAGAVGRGDVKLCDARVVWSESKSQWFVKLTFKYRRPVATGVGTGVAALRRGIGNAFVLSFADHRAELITGKDVIEFKARHKAKLVALGEHLRSLELGSGARGHGRKRWHRSIDRQSDAEKRYVDNRCKTWAAMIAKLCVRRSVGKLLVSKMTVRDMLDSVDGSKEKDWERVAPLLHQWPFAKMLTHVVAACEKLGIVVEEFDIAMNARRCPFCLHVHARRQWPLFKCDNEKCGQERPADVVVGLNALRDAVGEDVVEHELARRKVLQATFVEGE